MTKRGKKGPVHINPAVGWAPVMRMMERIEDELWIGQSFLSTHKEEEFAQRLVEAITTVSLVRDMANKRRLGHQR